MKNLNLETIKLYDSSKHRLHAIDIWKRKLKQESEDIKIVEKLNQANMENLQRMFRNAHALVKYSRSISDFKWLCQLDALKSFNIGDTYRNMMSAKIFISAIH